jgi:PAS domain S-box-containing protein
MSKATLHPSWFHLRKSLRTLARGVAQPGGKHPAKHIEVDGSPEVPSIEGVNRMATRIESLHNPVNTSEERWKTALDGIGIGVWDWDISTNTVQYSKQCKDMLGYAANEIANRYEAWLDLIHPEDLPAALRKIQEHFLGRTTSYSAEFRMLGKQGTWTWILSRGIVTDRDAAGKPLRMVGTHTDITAHRQSMEELKRHKDHLEERSLSGSGPHSSKRRTANSRLRATPPRKRTGQKACSWRT